MILSVVLSQSLSVVAETIVSLRELEPQVVCPEPLFGRSAVDSASGSCCGAVAIIEQNCKRKGHTVNETVSSNVDRRLADAINRLLMRSHGVT